MTAFAVVDRQSHRKMAYAAEFFVEYVFHFEMFGCLLFDIEYVRVTICTVEPLNMRCMRKYSWGYSGPFRPELKQLVKVQRFFILIKAVFRLYGPVLEGFYPVNLISVLRLREPALQFRKFSRANGNIVVMTLLAVFLGMTKGGFSVMTGATEEPVFVVFFSNLC